MAAQILINQATRPAGTAGKARSDGIVSQLVTCSNATAEASYLWTLVDVPIRSALVRGTTAVTASFTFTPDVKGTYLVSLRVNGSASASDNDSSYIGVASFGAKSLGWRYLGAGETTEDNEDYVGLGFPSDVNPRGWSTNEDVVYEEIETSVWETQNAISTFAGALQRVVMTEAATGKISSTLIGGAPPSGVAGGDLSGTYPNPTVASIQGRAVVTPLIPANGDALLWNSTTSKFEPGAAGVTDHGALTGLADNDHPQYAFAVDLSAHIADTSNPHGVTTTQIGAVPLARTITSGNGLTGGGTLTTNLTLNVVGHADGSIVANANDVQVGVLATDAQHGVRGGGTQHALVVSGGAAGFISGADKAILDSLTNDHGLLLGLTDDDHPQYLLIDGTRAMTGALVMSDAGTPVASITMGATAAEKGRVLSGFGSTAFPGLGFYGDDAAGFTRAAAGDIGVISDGALRWQFSGTFLSAMQSGMTISQSVTNGSLTFRGNQTTGLLSASMLFTNAAAFSGTSTGVQRGTVWSYTAAQNVAAAVGFSALQIDITNTSLGTGAQYFLDMKVGGTTIAGITNGSTAATQGRFLAGDGDSTTPSLGFLSAPTTKGFYSPTTNAIGVITSGSERWRFDGSNLFGMVNGATIRMNVANGGLSIYGNITSAADDRAGINIVNVSNMTGASGSARHVAVVNNVNQTGTAGYTALDISSVEVGTGSGAKYLINAKAGAAGTTQVFALTNEGSVLASSGSGSVPSLGWLSAFNTAGFFYAGSGDIGVVSDSVERWRFNGGGFYAMATGAGIYMNVANGAFSISGRVSFTSAVPSLLITNTGSFSAGSGAQVGTELDYTLAQTATAGFTALRLDVAGTSGSGAQSVITADWAGSQVFRVTNVGRVYVGAGTAALPSLSFNSSSTDGFYSISAGTIGISSSLYPATASTFNLGSFGNRWSSVYTDLLASEVEVFVGGKLTGWPFANWTFHGRDMNFDGGGDYWVDNGGDTYTTEIPYPLNREGRLKGIRVHVYASTTDASVLAELWINGAPSVISIILPASTTGVVTSTDEIDYADGDYLSWHFNGDTNAVNGTLSATISHDLEGI